MSVLVRNSEKIKTPGEHGEPIIFDLVDEVITGDATKPETLLGICDDIDIVFSSLGLTKPDFKHTSFDIDYRGNKRILDLALKAKVKKFIYISVFNAKKMLDISNIQAHEQFAGELRKSGMEYTIIRPTGYFSDMLQLLNLATMGIMPISFLLPLASVNLTALHRNSARIILPTFLKRIFDRFRKKAADPGSVSSKCVAPFRGDPVERKRDAFAVGFVAIDIARFLQSSHVDAQVTIGSFYPVAYLDE